MTDIHNNPDSELDEIILKLMSKHNKLAQDAIKNHHGGIWFTTPRSDQFQGELVAALTRWRDRAVHAELEKLSRKLNHDLPENQPVLLMIKDQQAGLSLLKEQADEQKH